MKIGICAIVKNEGEYLEEWMNHHRKLGISHFFIYDNNSDSSLYRNDGDYIYKLWSDDNHASQLRAYMDCVNKWKNGIDWMCFIDTDEFIMTKNNQSIEQILIKTKEKYGNFQGLGLSWRMYGKQEPYFNYRQPIEKYTQYHENNHIKSILNPKFIINFPDPHKAILNGIYINENGKPINHPLEKHTSENIWIKHTWTRSSNEFMDKILRGTGDKVVRQRTMQDFFNYNNECILND